MLARDARVQGPLTALEPSFAELDDEDRDRLGPVLAQAATALPLDIALMEDKGHQFVAIFPPEGSEGVDIVGKAAKWLTKRMTMDGDAPRVAMRRFLALLVPDTNRRMMPIVAVIAPGGGSAEYWAHEGEEFMLVVEGRILLEIENSTPIVLDQGDSAYYEATRRHRWTNLGDGPARVISVATPPTNL